jgi:hypothetical protein
MEIRETAGRVFIDNKRSSHQEIPPPRSCVCPPLFKMIDFLKNDAHFDILIGVLIVLGYFVFNGIEGIQSVIYKIMN